MTQAHRMLSRDLDSMTGACSVCGPVKLGKKAHGKGRFSYVCGVKCEQARQSPNRNKAKKEPHGLTADQAREWLRGKACAICGRTAEDGVKMCVDHCHLRGQIRAALCSPCNTALGLFQEDVERMEAAIAYLRLHGLVPGQTLAHPGTS